MSEKRYNLTNLTEEHILVIERACDLLARIHCGQLESVHSELQWGIRQEKEDGQVRERLLGKMLRTLNELVTGLHPNASHSIHNKDIPDDARVAYDLHKVIRHKRWQEREARGYWSVDSDVPRQASRVDLPGIEEAIDGLLP